MSGDSWDYKYVKSGNLKRKITPQMRALKKRIKDGLRMAKPAETRRRIEHIILLLPYWRGREDVLALADKWHVSESRIEQLVAEAKRKNG